MIHTWNQVQRLPIDIKTAWDFFSKPENLNDITPPDLRFKTLSDPPTHFYPGLFIIYQISVFKGIHFEWVTEITHAQEPNFFADEQRSGPYALWHHEHHFKEVEGGVEMEDKVYYKLPLGWLGNLFHNALVKPKLKHIFEYRRAVLENRFGVLA
jgi:ligand-binding SRPBCC domain-containing protein